MIRPLSRISQPNILTGFQYPGAAGAPGPAVVQVSAAGDLGALACSLPRRVPALSLSPLAIPREIRALHKRVFMQRNFTNEGSGLGVLHNLIDNGPGLTLHFRNDAGLCARLDR